MNIYVPDLVLNFLLLYEPRSGSHTVKDEDAIFIHWAVVTFFACYLSKKKIQNILVKSPFVYICLHFQKKIWYIDIHLLGRRKPTQQ